MEEPFGAGAFGIWSSTRLNSVHKLPPSKEGSTIYMIADVFCITLAGKIFEIFQKNFVLNTLRFCTPFMNEKGRQKGDIQ